jgi:hypothetical protein
MKLIPTGLLFVASFGLTACATLVDDSEPKELTESLSSAAKVDPDGNGLDTWKTVNAPIFATQSYASALLNNPLRNSSMTSDVKTSVCADHNSHEALRYVVRCAFNAGHNLELTCTNSSDNDSMKGLFGLADSWGDTSGSCTTASCREWVSACVLALSNFAGATGMPVELTGNHTALSAAKSSAYPKTEGAYWGDVFNENGTGQQRYGCRGDDAAVTYPYNGLNLKLQSRTCGFFNLYDWCNVCTGGTSADQNNNCGSNPHVPYFMNLYNGKVRTCAPLCATDAAATSGYFNNCTPTGSGTASARVLTVWRR